MEADIIKELLKHGLALAASDSDGSDKAIIIPSLLVSVIQHLSGNPWVTLDFSAKSFLGESEIEWDWLTEGVDKSRKSQFWTQLKQSAQLEDCKPGLSVIRRYFQKDFCLFSVEIGEHSTPSILQRALVSSEEVKCEDLSTQPLDFYDKYENSEEKVFILFVENQPPRLISSIQKLHPTKQQLGEKLIDTFGQLGIFQFTDNNTSLENLENMTSTTGVLNGISSKIERLAQSKSFTEILNQVLPNGFADYTKLIQELVELEKSLDQKDLCELRITLIQLITIELYHPIRQAIIRQKEKQQLICMEAAEKQEILAKEFIYLQTTIEKQKEELASLDVQVSQLNENIKSLALSRQSRKAELITQLSEMEEREAFNQFITELNNFDPTRSMEVLSSLKDLNYTELPLDKLLHSLISIFKTTPPNQKLLNRISKQLESDRREIIGTLEVMRQIPVVEIDNEGDISIQGNNLILSSILPQIVQSVESRKPNQLKIVCQESLVLDKSLEKKYFSGMNIVLIANNVIAADAEINIDVSGIDGVSHEGKADDGVGDGSDGQNGLDGIDGTHGGDVYIEALTSIVNEGNIHINCKGGNGGNGQDGGNGMDGRSGKDGEKGNLNDPAWFEKYWAIGKGTPGKPGQEGGAKGLGGRAGAGGISGKATIVINGKEREIPFEGGKEGTAGKDGNCGQNGIHGQKGMDHGRAAMYMFQGWVEKEGYDLGIKEIPGWVYNGYELVENGGPEVHKTQQTTRHNTKEKKSNANKNQKSEINKQTISNMKNNILKLKGKTIDSNKSTEASVNLKEELSHLSDSSEISKKAKEVEQLQKLKASANESLVKSQTKHNSIQEAMSKAKEEEIQAELMSKEFEQVAQNFKERQAEDLQRVEISQHQEQMEVQSEIMVMVDKTASLNEDDDGPPKKTAKVTNTLSNLKHNKIYQLYMELSEKLKGDFEAISSLECAMQIVASNIVDYENVFRRVSQNSDYLSYIKTHLIEDTKAALEFRDLSLSLPWGCESLLDFFVKFRCGQIHDEISHKKLNSSEFSSFIKSLEIDTKVKRILAEWKDQKTENEESLLAKKSRDLRDKFKKSVIKQGKLIFCEMEKIFNNNSQTPENFLKNLIEFSESQSDANFLQGELLSAFLKKNFGYDKIYVTSTLSSLLNKKINLGAAWNKYKGRSSEAVQVLTQAKFVLTHVHFNLDELSEISDIVSHMKTQDDLSEFATLVDELVSIIENQYNKTTCNVLSNIKSEIQKLQPEMKKNVSNLFQKICAMLNSTLLNFSYSDRMKHLEKIQTEVTLSNLIKVSQELYPQKHGKYIDNGELHFGKFHAYLVKKLFQADLERDKLNQMLMHVQIGKLSGRTGIEDFSKQELVLLEKFFWDTLYNIQSHKNYKERWALIHKFQEAIEQRKSLEFNTQKLEADCNVTQCKETFSKLLKRTLAYIPRGDTESTITDAYKKRSQLKYLFLRAEYVTIKSCTCSKVEELDGILFNTAINEVDEIIDKVENWVNQQESTLNNCTMKKDESRLQFLQRQKSNLMQDGEIEYYLIFQSGLRHCNVLNDSEISEEENGILSEIIEKLSGDMKSADTKDPSEVKRVKDLFTFIQKREPGYHPMQNLQQLHSQSYQMQLDRWRDVQKLLRKAKQILNNLKGSSQKDHSSTPLYLCAQFSEAVERKIISKLNLYNVVACNDELEEIFTCVTRLNAEMECEEQVQIGKVARILQAKAMGYPFTEELMTLLRIQFPKRSEISKQGYLFLKGILDNREMNTNRKAWPNLWTELTKLFTGFETENMYKLKYLKFHLAAFLVKLDYQDSRTPLLLRMIQKVLEYKEKAKKDIQVVSSLEPHLISSDLYSILIPEYNVEQIFLNDKETEIFREILKLGLEVPELEKEIKNIICHNHPMKWLGLLERLYFNKTFKVFAGPSSQNLEERDSLKEIVFLAKLKDRGKRILRAIQQTHTYNEFKLSYLLQENESTRKKWLITFNKMLKKLTDGEEEVFSSVRDCKTFLTFIRDIDIEDFEEIVHKRFPQNWLKWVLIKCLAKDVEKLPGTLSNVESPEETLLKVLSPINPAKIKLLLILHPLLKSGNEENVTKQMLFTFLRGIASANFTESKLNNVNYELTLCPFSYWNRVVRIHNLCLKCNNYPREVVECLLGMDERFGETMVDSVVKNVLQAEEKLLSEEDKRKILNNFYSTEWILDDESLKLLEKKQFAEIEKIVKNYSSSEREKELSLQDIILRLKAHPINQRKENYLTLIDQIQRRIEGIHEYLETKLFIPDKISKESFEKEIEKFLGKWKSKYGAWKWNDHGKINEELICHTMALLYRAVQYHFSKVEEGKIIKPRNTQLISVLMLIDGIARSQPMGKLGEIETGEGKTCIVAMFAAFCALLKANVHVITSNKLLAQDGADEAKGFFKILGLSAGNNCDKDCMGESERKKRYDTNNVVYGELSGFQADILNTDFHEKNVISANKRADIVIVDEVDSLLLDKGSHMLYLSHGIPELKYLRPIFLVIWRAVMFHKMNKNQTKASESDIHSVRTAVEKQVKEFPEEVRLPACLKDFVSRRMGVWVKQAFIARFMPINEDFIVEEGQHKIVNMDNDTGVEQGNMHMSLGLHQFLQLKYKMKLSPESLKCVFMSNNKYFKDHKGKIFGITGTLGAEEETSLVGRMYEVEFFAMPRYKLNKRVEEKEIIVPQESEWLEKIRESITEHSKNQPILVISENVAKHEKIKKQIEKDFKEGKIHEYTSSERHTDFIKEIKDGDGLEKGSIVLSTNLGGRGTDLKVHKDAKERGLHVILTFLPKNLRVEKQAFGRTARAGENGTVQFILCSKAKKKSTEELQSLYDLKEERRRMESKRLQAVETRDMQKINIEDELFSQYQKFVKEQIQTATNFTRHKKRVRVVQLEFLNNRWAVWLDSIRDQLDILHLQRELGKKAIQKHFKLFKEEMVKKMENNKDFTMFAEFTSEFQKLAIVYEKIAIKALFSSALSGDWTDAREIAAEWWENIKSGWNATGNFVQAGWSCIAKQNPQQIKEILKEVNEKLNSQSPPSDIDIGINILGMASKTDKQFSHGASAYLGTMKLQKEPTDRAQAKKDIKEAKKKIVAHIELNTSAISMLDEACSKLSKDKEMVFKHNKFREQILSENNLLHIHLDSLNSTMHSPISPSLLKSQITEIDTIGAAEKLQKILLNEKWDLLENYRISKRKDEKEKDFADKTHPIWKHQLPCTLSALAKLCKKLKNESSGQLFEELKSVVISKGRFLENLMSSKMTTSVDVHLVTVDGITKTELEEHQADLKDYPDEVIMLLFQHNRQLFPEARMKELKADKTIDELKIIPKPKTKRLISDEDIEKLKTILENKSWIKSINLPVKATEALGQVIQILTLTPEEIESYGYPDEVVQFKETELFQIYLRLVNQREIDHPIPAYEDLISYATLPFPDTVEEGVHDLLQVLVSYGIVKEPRVKFPSICATEEDINQATEKIKKTFESEDFSLELKILYEEVKGEENKFNQFKKSIRDLLLDSVGSLKRFAKIRVNYESIASKVHLDSSVSNEELQELISEGIFDRIIILDEQVRFWENYSAIGVMVLGIAEIGCGVAIEFASGGLLSPLAAFLISEGSSDVMYSFKHLYHGNRVQYDDYKEHKLNSMDYSLSTAWTGVFTIGSPVTAVVLEFAKAGVKQMALMFIEGNIQKAYQNNMLGLKVILDNVFQNEEVKNELELFSLNATKLWGQSWEETQAEKIISKMVCNITEDSGETAFSEELEKTGNDLSWTIYRGMANTLARGVLPTSKRSLKGFFGSNKKLGDRCTDEISSLVLSTLLHINRNIVDKTNRLASMREEFVYLNESDKGDEEDFKHFLQQELMTLKEGLRQQIIAHFYEQISSQKIKKNLYETIRSGYSVVIQEHEISLIKARDEHDWETFERGSHKVTREEVQRKLEMEEKAREQVTIVANAQGRSISEVKSIWEGLGESAGDIEFLQDLYGNCFVSLRSEESMKHSFVLSKDEFAFDNYIEFREAV